MKNLILIIIISLIPGCNAIHPKKDGNIHFEFHPPFQASLGINGHAVVHWKITSEDPLSAQICGWLNTHKNGWKTCKMEIPANVFIRGRRFQININDQYMAILYSEASEQEYRWLYRKRDSEVDVLLEAIKEWRRPAAAQFDQGFI